jgi:hypothetical protein
MHLLNKHAKDFVKYKTQFEFAKGGMERGKKKSKNNHVVHPSAIKKYFSGHRRYEKGNLP